MSTEVYEVIPTGTLSGQYVQNVMHVNVDNTAATAPFTVANAILTKFNGASQWVSKYCGMLPDSYNMTSIRCRRVLPSGGPTAIILQGQLTESTGGRSGQESASATSPLIIWLTDLRPSKTGRTFVPGVSEDDCDQNQLQSGVLADLIAFANYHLTGGTLTSPTYSWNGSILRRGQNTADEITAARISPIIGVQRRRQRPI